MLAPPLKGPACPPPVCICAEVVFSYFISRAAVTPIQHSHHIVALARDIARSDDPDRDH